MANLNYKKNTTEKFDVKGVLDDTATTVTYEDKEEGENHNYSPGLFE